MRYAGIIGARRAAAVLGGLALGVGAVFSVAHPAARAAAHPAGAPDGPGAQSYLNLARKDCFATARNTTSKVWYSVADGVLSDVFSPNLEASNLSTLQYVVSDGHSFTDLQQRDMTYTVSSPDPTGMVCRVTSHDTRHGFELITDYSTDPARASVLTHTRLAGPAALLRQLRVYVRYDALIDNTGGGGKTNALPNDATIDPATGALVASDSVRPTGPFSAQVVGALLGDRRFGRSTSGFVDRASDGLHQLDAAHHLTHDYRTAVHGNVVQTAEIRQPTRPFTLALGYAPSAAGAIAVAQRSAQTPYRLARERYVEGWRAYDAGLHAPTPATARSYWLAANMIKSAEDKSYPGAFVAAPADPWGQSMLALTTHAGYTYRSVFARDSYETFTGLLADGDRSTARAMVRFLFDRAQQPDGSFPRDSLLNGEVAPDTYGLYEIDEDAYPLLMAWQAGFAGDRTLYTRHLRADADFVVAHGPAYGEERWEEHKGYSPSTLASEIAGLTAASQLAAASGDSERARLYQATADAYQRQVKAWTVTDSGPYGAGRYFLRLSPTGDPNAAEYYDLNNGSLGHVDQRRVVDAGFLELTRLGELPAGDPDVTRSLAIVDSIIARATPSGTGWHRYGVQASGSTDGYGDCYEPDPTSCSPSGAPSYNGVGSGHVWPTLSGERGEQDLQTGDAAGASGLATTMRRMSWGIGLVPEQAWEDPNIPPAPYGSDPASASIGFTDGQAAGSANPLIWAEGQYVRLLRDLQTGTLVDQPAATRERYVAAGPPAVDPLAITAPAPGSSASGSTTVRGTTTPGAQVTIAVSAPGASSDQTTVVHTTAPSGSFAATVAVPRGADLITVTATRGGHDSGWAQEPVTGS